MEPLISIIIPIYKVEDYLQECIESVLSQTYKNIEVILVDDGSPDNCGKICDDFEKRDGRIRVIHKENGGLSSARNEGIDACKGDYISFIDSDDYVSPCFIEILYKTSLLNDADVTTCWGGLAFDADNEYRPKLLEIADFNTAPDWTELCTAQIINKKEALRKMLYQEIANGAQFRLYKRKIFKDIRFPVGYVFEDVATTYKTFITADRMAIVKADIYGYRVRKDSIVRMPFSEKKMVVIEITETMFRDICNFDRSLENAAASRAFAQNYHVFLQIPFSDKGSMNLVWTEMKKYRHIVLRDRCKSVRLKNKVASFVTYFGMNASYFLGKLYLKVR